MPSDIQSPSGHAHLTPSVSRATNPGCGPGWDEKPARQVRVLSIYCEHMGGLFRRWVVEFL